MEQLRAWIQLYLKVPPDITAPFNNVAEAIHTAFVTFPANGSNLITEAQDHGFVPTCRYLLPTAFRDGYKKSPTPCTRLTVMVLLPPRVASASGTSAHNAVS